MLVSRRKLAILIVPLLCCLLGGCGPAEVAREPSAAANTANAPAVDSSSVVADIATSPAKPAFSEAAAWDHASNLLQNASFEEGAAPWFSLRGPEKLYWMEFDVSDAQAHSGRHSALFRVNSEGEIHRGTRIWGVIRDLELEALPRRLSGWYRVDDWQRGSPNQYLQAVICVFDPEDFPELRGSPVQLAYVLAGIDAPPFRIRNRKFLFAGPTEPETGEWVAFDFDVHADFTATWGRVPAKFGKVRVFFEARFDDPRPAADLRGDVYFDDLYFGDGD